ncbi:MAG: hypothetical protein N2376_03215 [Clostridia bacterium]|nr:hypothetical protein [Clostridia bacterium]
MAVRIVRKNKANLITTIIIVILNMVVISSLVFLGLNQIKSVEKSYKGQINELKYMVASNKKQVLVPISDIKFNSVLEEALFEKKEIVSSLPQTEFISESDFGKLSVCDLKAQLPVTKNMIAEQKLPDDVREMEFNMFFLQTNLTKNDYVDIRLRFPNGEDYIVLAKRKIIDINSKQNTIWTWLNEKEIMTISSAIIDAYLNKGSKIYITKYVQAAMQKELVPTYPFNNDVKNAMLSNPNILEKASMELAAQARKALDERLMRMSQEDISNVDSGVTQEQAKSTEATEKAATQPPSESQAATPPAAQPAANTGENGGANTNGFFNQN